MTRPEQVYLTRSHAHKLRICSQLMELQCKEEMLEVILDQYFEGVPELKEILNATDRALVAAIQRRKQHDPTGSTAETK